MPTKTVNKYAIKYNVTSVKVTEKESVKDYPNNKADINEVRSGVKNKDLWTAGFEVIARTRPYSVRFNVHPKPGPGARERVRSAAFRLLTGDDHPGVLHQALLTRKRV